MYSVTTMTDHFAKLPSVLFRISTLIIVKIIFVKIICITTYNESYYTSFKDGALESSL